MVEFHPDRHASSDEEVKTEMAEKATDVTRAYNTIGDPLSRALYLLELHGASLEESDNVSSMQALGLLLSHVRLFTT